MQVVKIQPQTFKSSYIKLIVLLWSLIYSLLFSIFIEAISRDAATAAYIASLTVFVIFGVVYLITAVAYILIRNVRIDCRCLKVTWFVDISYFIGGIVYYVGRNFPFLARIFPYQMPCDNASCQQSMQIAQSFLLGTVVVFFRFIPFFISKYYQSKLAKEHQTTETKLQLVPEWILAAESLTLLVEFDALYTVIVNSFLLISCDPLSAQVIAAWVLWALFVLMYIFILYYTMNIQYCGNCNVNWSCVISNFSAFLALAAFGLYLSANDYNTMFCSGANVGIAWIVMKILVLIVVITAIVLLLVYRCLSKTLQEKLLPRALYQQMHPEPDEQSDLLPEKINNDDDKKDYVY